MRVENAQQLRHRCRDGAVVRHRRGGDAGTGSGVAAHLQHVQQVAQQTNDAGTGLARLGRRVLAGQRVRRSFSAWDSVPLPWRDSSDDSRSARRSAVLYNTSMPASMTLAASSCTSGL